MLVIGSQEQGSSHHCFLEMMVKMTDDKMATKMWMKVKAAGQMEKVGAAHTEDSFTPTDSLPIKKKMPLIFFHVSWFVYVSV